ncbi:MAG: prolyl oligopeptidase family serine peptidase [Candidatus Marinimicrobia bacterium]|jgi:dipeptidyl aminopeptidase/acylaminoacyl peptidase|nr:prolyl oligopeptidase family serine peptidase [Candidatus Neomarinimicrobiota bacterium]MBT3936943.1 prolyl oligopeptidase family serine peptidase [Candidatus Neomarinimicrobiota bacterium]MBT3962337.1 prolyl oligopeptidase family serine peptidase [Candidatus Neomarinimicrobiota bacterium]MBT4382365.1 prolyl oligopeptidase family serine peptidase [Candidatus Neomarinimicrobiota bacterium]MBT4635844.1 prolyl oligopeptidase family serine peptidase [Candidatus Neomarinimicrobiota bacterium]
MNTKEKLELLNLLKPHFALIALILFIASCTQTYTPTKYSIEQFYQNNRIGGGSFSDDETKLLVRSDESGIFNVYEIDIVSGVKTQKTFSEKESYFAIDYLPGTNHILFSADKGGDELNHIYLMNEDGATTDLTPGENEKARFAGWSKDKKSMYFISNKRNPKFFDFYKMNIETWESEMLYQNDNGINISNMSEDETWFAFSQTITTSENKLFLTNRIDNSTIELSEESGSYNASGFSKDNKYFFFITDVDKEFSYLVKYNIETGEKEVLFETNWDVMYSYLSENERYRVIAINEDGKNNLFIKDLVNNSDVYFPEIPDGDIKGVSFSESEEKIRLTIGTSKSPDNIYFYNMGSQELKKLTETLNPVINANDMVAAEVVRYPSFDGLEIPAIYYKPIDASKRNKVPALVWVHGGPGGQSRTGYSSFIQYLVNHGYAILAVNNRGSSGYGKTFYKMDDLNHGDKDLKDCIWGKRWLQAQDYIDAEKIGIIGGSYGGYMTMAAMTFTPDEFKVGVNIFGVTNWLRTLKSIPPYWESFRNALYKELGDPTTTDSVRLYEISPVFHAHKVKNPVMVLQGANDPRVLKIESDEIVAGIEANGITVEYVVFDDEGHGFRKKENEIEGYRKVLTFLETYLKGEGGISQN